ncbi:MAG: hypothetical protein LBR79_02955 [Oscillospiraceae bacterium]|jgi:hypothetical protein|nr:hypothetical protein [Oscillospiraceae bacterium]
MANSSTFIKCTQESKKQILNPSTIVNLDGTKYKKATTTATKFENLVDDYKNATTPEEKIPILSELKNLYAKLRDLTKKYMNYHTMRGIFTKIEDLLITAGIDPLKLETQIKEQAKIAKENQKQQEQQKS